METQVAQPEMATYIAVGGFVALAVVIVGACQLHENRIRRLAKPATVRVVLEYFGEIAAMPSMDCPLPWGGECIFTTVEHGNAAFSVNRRVFPGQTVGIYIPEGKSFADATVIVPFRSASN